MAIEVQYLTVDQVIEMHEKALQIPPGGLEGLRSDHALMSAVFQPQTTVFGEDAYPTVPEKAAAYAFLLSEGHPFVDGNKRTAAFALTVFLDLNGYELWESDPEELSRMLIELASDVIDQSEFFGWVVNHARPITLSSC